MPKTILIVDDEWPVRLALKVRLSAKGYAIALAEDGAAGLRAAAEQQPDVILLDLRMPDMDGLEVLRQLRAAGSTALIPVIMLTANVQDTIEQQARSAGVSDFITKPYNAEDIINAIERIPVNAP